MRVLNVRGMTCNHCVRAVTDAVRDVEPGSDVLVDLAAGTVAVQGGSDLAGIAAAIEDAGYEVDYPG